MDRIDKNSYKTKLCKYFKNGNCNKGEKCTFAHDSKKIICKYGNSCHKKDKCNFLHTNINSNIKINEEKTDIIDYKDEEKKEDISINLNFSINGEEINYSKLNEILNIDEENKYIENDINTINNNIVPDLKINEEEIYEKVINDKKIMNSYGKVDNNFDLLENNINIMVKYYKEHAKIIKENLENNSIDAKLNNLSNYYFDNIILLNKISYYIDLFEENCKDILKQEKMIKNGKYYDDNQNSKQLNLFSFLIITFEHIQNLIIILSRNNILSN